MYNVDVCNKTINQYQQYIQDGSIKMNRENKTVHIGQVVLVRLPPTTPIGDEGKPNIMPGYVVDVPDDETVSVMPMCEVEDHSGGISFTFSEMKDYCGGRLTLPLSVKKNDTFVTNKDLYNSTSCGNTSSVSYLQQSKKIREIMAKLQHLQDLSSSSIQTKVKLNAMLTKAKNQYDHIIKNAIESNEISNAMVSRDTIYSQHTYYRLLFKPYDGTADNNAKETMKLALRHVIEAIDSNKRWGEKCIANNVVTYSHGIKLLQILLPQAGDSTKFNQSTMVGGDILFVVGNEGIEMEDAVLNGICSDHQIQHSGRPFVPIILHHKTYKGLNKLSNAITNGSIYKHFSRFKDSKRRDVSINMEEAKITCQKYWRY